MNDLEERIRKFNSLSLPGQGFSMHMGTSYLVNDLWREVQRLRRIEAAAGLVVTDGHEYIGPANGWVDLRDHDETLTSLAAALSESEPG